MINFTPQLLWVDLEMSGLDPMKHKILQFACILTDTKLEKQQQGPALIIHCEEEHLKTMDQWCTSHHKASGLYSSCLESKISLKQAEQHILDWLKSLKICKGQLTLAGNSIHQDKLFLHFHMPDLNQFLHYRILDVTSVKTVVNAKQPQLFYKKKGSHRAIDDIRESIGELKYYMKQAFK